MTAGSIIDCVTEYSETIKSYSCSAFKNYDAVRPSILSSFPKIPNDPLNNFKRSGGNLPIYNPTAY